MERNPETLDSRQNPKPLPNPKQVPKVKAIVQHNIHYYQLVTLPITAPRVHG